MQKLLVITKNKSYIFDLKLLKITNYSLLLKNKIPVFQFMQAPMKVFEPEF